MDYFMVVAMMIAYVVKGLCGFANTLVFTSILAFHQSNISIAPVEVISGYPSNLIIVWKERKNLSWRIWLPLSLLVIAGCLPGIFFLKMGNARVLKILFGVVVIVVGMEMLLRDRQTKKSKSNAIILAAIGVLSGLLCGLFGIGALIAAYMGRTTQDSSAFKGNLCMVFAIENTFRITVYVLTGIITAVTVKSAVSLIPFMLIGLLIGMGLSRFINEKYLKKIIIIMLIISGISLILHNIF